MDFASPIYSLRAGVQTTSAPSGGIFVEPNPQTIPAPAHPRFTSARQAGRPIPLMSLLTKLFPFGNDVAIKMPALRALNGLSPDLTPALSSKERGKRSQRPWKNPRLDWPDGRSQNRKRPTAVPSPGGEGQDEGG
jgi:hypothetical protein